MITIPFETIKEKIKEKTGLSDEEIEQKIRKKLDQLSGLISKEGAAHIVANELGLKLMQVSGAIKIKDMAAGMKNLELLGKAIRKYEVREFNTEKRAGKLAKFLIGDETGTTIIVMWNDKADLLTTFKEGDILRVKGVTARENNGRVELHLNDSSAIDVNPEGVKIESTGKTEQSQTSFQRPAATRKKIKDLLETDQNIEILGTIVQIFDLKFFRLNQETGKRMKDEELGEYTTSCVLNIFIDDGTDNIRTVLWKNQVLNLLGINEQQLLAFKDTPELFEQAKTDLLGMIVKIIGRVSKNTLFNRLELTANVVIREVNPEEEMKFIAKEAPASSKPQTQAVVQATSQAVQQVPRATSTATQVVSAPHTSMQAAVPTEAKKTEVKSSKPKEELLPSDIDDELLSLEDIEDLDEDI